MIKSGKIVVAGIGPGSAQDITSAVTDALKNVTVVIGYKYYFQFIESYIKEGVSCIDTGMKQEVERARLAFEYAQSGESVMVISSGDAGIYGMAPLIWEMQQKSGAEVEIEVIPGISAFQKAASLLGAPIGHDFCVVSMSDLMTPWRVIEKRIKAAAYADFVTAIYNPKSKGRYWQLYRLKEIFLTERSPDTPVGYVRQAGREEQQIIITTLSEFDPEQIDMFTVVIIGNSQSYISSSSAIITPRGYYSKEKEQQCGVGQQIMIESFKTIESELANPNIDTDRKWTLLHTIHTSADFDMEHILYTDKQAVNTLHQGVKNGDIKTIITDVTMVSSGIRKGALERLGVEVKCYLSDPRVADMVSELGITRTQAGIRLAAVEHPEALYVFGNAPTALMELCTLIRRGKVKPVGVIAAPVGFVNVCESKYMIKSFDKIPKIIVEGRKGGSTLAATIVNSILTLDDAVQMRPGKDL